MSQPPLNALRVFEAVARNGSFRAAAEELFVSQPAVSHQIRHLEHWLGEPLFERVGNRPQLLPHARVLAQSLNTALSEIDAACQRARRSTGPPTLVIAAIPSVAVCWLIPRLAAFRDRYPDIAVRIIYAFHGQPDQGEADLAFIYAQHPEPRPGTRLHTFLPGLSAPVCSPSVRDAMQHETFIDNLVHAGFLHDSDQSGWTRWFAESSCDEPSELAGTVFEDFNLLRAAVLAGQGVALCPLAMLRDDLASGHLVQLSDVTINQAYNYYLVEHETLGPPETQATQAFISWLLETRDAQSHVEQP